MAIMCADGQQNNINELGAHIAKLEQQELNLWLQNQDSNYSGESDGGELEEEIEKLRRKKLGMMSLANNLVVRRRVQLWNEAVISEGTTDEEMELDDEESGEEDSHGMAADQGSEVTDAKVPSDTTATTSRYATNDSKSANNVSDDDTITDYSESSPMGRNNMLRKMVVMRSEEKNNRNNAATKANKEMMLSLRNREKKTRMAATKERLVEKVVLMHETKKEDCIDPLLRVAGFLEGMATEHPDKGKCLLANNESFHTEQIAFAYSTSELRSTINKDKTYTAEEYEVAQTLLQFSSAWVEHDAADAEMIEAANTLLQLSKGN